MKTLLRPLSILSAMLAAAMLAPGQASARPGPVRAADQVFIKQVTYGGSGCTTNDSVSELDDVNQDGFPDQFSIFYFNYIAHSGPGTNASDWRKNCNINVILHLPQGFQFSIFQAHYAGFTTLPFGISGTQTSTYTFVFHPGSATLHSTWHGPIQQNYDFTDTLRFESLVWSPCGLEAPLNIRTQIFLSGSTQQLISDPSALITTDEIDGRVKQIFGFQWRACQSRKG